MVGHVAVTSPSPIRRLSLKANLCHVPMGLHVQIPQADIVPGEGMVSQCCWHFLLLCLVCAWERPPAVSLVHADHSDAGGNG